MVYYNEINPYAAQWLRELIENGLIAHGYVDERSIEDVKPNELIGYTQCHFFAGIGGWSLALRLAGWPDDRPVWTGSCPCQSFSTAGKGKGFADERHLWPIWFHLIGECKPATIFGEQVDAAIRHGWLDLVQTDLEALGYAFGSAVIPAAGVGAPHGRHRVWFVAFSDSTRCESWKCAAEATRYGDTPISESDVCMLVNSQSEQERISRFARESRKTAGFWNDADWIPCSDGCWRPIEPGIFPLANGVFARMDKLRGFGNAIVPEVAKVFIESVMCL